MVYHIENVSTFILLFTDWQPCNWHTCETLTESFELSFSLHLLGISELIFYNFFHRHNFNPSFHDGTHTRRVNILIEIVYHSIADIWIFKALIINFSWNDYIRTGKRIVKTRFIAFKVPLREVNNIMFHWITVINSFFPIDRHPIKTATLQKKISEWKYYRLRSDDHEN